MVRKLFIAVLLSGFAFSLPAANGLKTFKPAQEMYAVKAGTVINTEIEFESEPGFVLTGWNCTLIRKNSAPEFFQKSEVKIRPHKTHKDYDAIDIVKYNTLPQAQAAGKFPVRINTAGMPVGEYAMLIQGRWVKDGKAFYPGSMIYVAVTEADNGKFAPTAQTPGAAANAVKKAAPTPKWCQKIAVTPNPVTAAAGSKIAFSCDYEALPGEFFGGYVVLVLRKNAPAAFFDQNQAKVKKHPTASGYDSLIIKPFAASPNQAAAKIAFELDSTNYPAGDYELYLQIRVVKSDGKTTAYPSYPVNLSIK